MDSSASHFGVAEEPEAAGDRGPARAFMTRRRQYDSLVAGIMASLDGNFTALKHHLGPVLRQGAVFDLAAAKHTADLLNRSIPMTEAEMIVAATLRWLAHQDRNAFIKYVFAARCACAGQYVDSRMVGVGLGTENVFHASLTPDGYSLRDPSAQPPPRPAGRRGRRGARAADGRAAAPGAPGADLGGYRLASRGKPAGHAAPVLDDGSWKALMDQLDSGVFGGGASAAAPPTTDHLSAASLSLTPAPVSAPEAPTTTDPRPNGSSTASASKTNPAAETPAEPSAEAPAQEPTTDLRPNPSSTDLASKTDPPAEATPEPGASAAAAEDPLSVAPLDTADAPQPAADLRPTDQPAVV